MLPRGVRALAAALALLPAWGSVALAAPPPTKPKVEERAWRLSLEAALDLPLFVAGRATLESPDRIRFSASGGVMPAPFFAGINGIVVAAGGYDRATADVVAASLHNPGMGRFQLGWRPWASRGWYFEAGYAFTALGASNTQEALLTAIVGPIANLVPDGSRVYRVSSTLQMLSLEAGYQWVMVEHLVVRLGLGYTGTLASHTSVKTDAIASPEVMDYSARVSDYLDGVFRHYVHLPLISFGIGGRIDGPPVED